MTVSPGMPFLTWDDTGMVEVADSRQDISDGFITDRGSLLIADANSGTG